MTPNDQWNHLAISTRYRLFQKQARINLADDWLISEGRLYTTEIILTSDETGGHARLEFCYDVIKRNQLDAIAEIYRHFFFDEREEKKVQ